MNIIFLGTPKFAIASIEAIKKSKHRILAVVCQPDNERDRKGNVIYCPVKEYAIANNIPCYQWAKISRDGIEDLKKLNPDIMITASYGQILSQQVIDIPKYGIINIHGSLLPKYRGASPIQSAIIDGESETGITIMQTEAGLDTGDILSVEKVQIGEEETAGELMDRLSKVGANLLVSTLEQIENGTVVPIKQSHTLATFTTKITKKESQINFEKTAEQVKCQILGHNPSPISYTMLNSQIFNIYRARWAKDIPNTNEKAGTVIEPTSVKRGLFVQCGSGVVEIMEAQLQGKRKMSSTDLLNGRIVKVGDCFEKATSAIA